MGCLAQVKTLLLGTALAFFGGKQENGRFFTLYAAVGQVVLTRIG
jgi:hypothetical protein